MNRRYASQLPYEDLHKGLLGRLCCLCNVMRGARLVAAMNLSDTELLSYVVEAMSEALVLLDENLVIRFINPAAIEILQGIAVSKSPIGMYYFDYVGITPDSDQYDGSALKHLLNQGIAYRGHLYQMPSGKYISVNAVPLTNSGPMRGILLTAQDVTTFVAMENELDHAFGLTLPNSKVEYKLKNTVEYQDEYDPETKMITVTGIISDGGYRHVVNSLKIFASLKAQGIANTIAIDKDLLVQAIIFHDLGKSQPILNVGDVVDPRAVFEDGKFHAARGAEIAKHFYAQPDDVIELIRYHHHSESQLPESFPWRLLPMLRLFQVVDGLSAAITRGGVEVDFRVVDCIVYVTERNRRPQYNGKWLINLFTGERRRVE